MRVRDFLAGVVFAGAGILPAYASVITVQDTTATGNSPSSLDSYLRQDGAADTNGGAVFGDVRMYPDVNFASGKGPRHNLVWFDVSGIPAGSIINSATY